MYTTHNVIIIEIREFYKLPKNRTLCFRDIVLLHSNCCIRYYDSFCTKEATAVSDFNYALQRA